MKPRTLYRVIVERDDGKRRPTLFWPSVETAVKRALTLCANEPGLRMLQWPNGTFVVEEREVDAPRSEP